LTRSYLVDNSPLLLECELDTFSQFRWGISITHVLLEMSQFLLQVKLGHLLFRKKNELLQSANHQGNMLRIKANPHGNGETTFHVLFGTSNNVLLDLQLQYCTA